MANINDKFFIKVDSNLYYNKDSAYKSVNQINTIGGTTYPTVDDIKNKDSWRHPVLCNFKSNDGSKLNLFRHIESTSTSKFINDTYGIDFKYDKLNDCKKPLISGRFFKDGKDCPVMHPYMMSVLNKHCPGLSAVSINGVSATISSLSSGSLPITGIVVLQGGGGGGGWSNVSGADCGGGGGGGGGTAVVYYRCKFVPTASFTISASAGGGGSSGNSGGASTLSFSISGPSGSYSCSISAGGGSGGAHASDGGAYASGGHGGNVYYVINNATTIVSGISKGTGGADGVGNSAGTETSNVSIVDNDYLVLYLIWGAGGGGGGRGDDTDGSYQAQGGAGGHSETITNFPFVLNSRSYTVPGGSGGGRATDYSDGGAGGGGASSFGNGGGGGYPSKDSTAGNGGTGAGGGGGGIYSTNKAGGSGGGGFVWLLTPKTQ